MTDEKDRLTKVKGYVSIIFMVIIGIATLWQLRLTVRQTNLIFKPVIGIVSVKTTRLHKPGTEDTYESVSGFRFRFTIKNVGNLPAKNFKMGVAGKLGKTTLAIRETFDKSHEGVVMIQGATTFNTPTIDKKVIETLRLSKKVRFNTK